jgi:hypothetical protein
MATTGLGRRGILQGACVLGILASTSHSQDQDVVPLAVAVSHTATRVIHRYSVTPTPSDQSTMLERVAVDTRGPFPIAVRAPRGWKYTIGTPPGSSAMWGCEWRVEWQVPKGQKGTPGKPVSGFVLEFVGKEPKSYCHGELEYRDGGIYAFGGPDHVPMGVP